MNLFWALDRLAETGRTRARRQDRRTKFVSLLLDEAHAIDEEDRRVCRAIGRHGATLLQRRPRRAHALQRRRAGHGRLRHGAGRVLCGPRVGQAAARLRRRDAAAVARRRLTAWELQQRGIDVTLICDSMAAQVMREGRVQAVVTGADRIAANGDTANKIGTYGVALLAAAHDIPFYVAAPLEHVRSLARLRRPDSDRTARSRRNHARLRPPHRPGRHRRLQPGLRRHARPPHPRHHLRARRDRARDARTNCRGRFVRLTRSRRSTRGDRSAVAMLTSTLAIPDVMTTIS